MVVGFRLRAGVLAAMAALLAAGCSSSSHQSAPPSLTTTPTTASRPIDGTAPPVRKPPCGTMSTAPAYRHVIWIFMENHSYGTVIGARAAPYINSLAATCGLATNYHNVTHPSLPNYIAATSGLNLADLQPFTPDCSPTGSCSTTAKSIFAQGESWKSYEESMPSNCARSDAGNYAVRHNPPRYYTTLSGCSTFDVPYTQLGEDLAD
ncbi:MAG: hypothetical protein J2P57_22010, partial [Acidimicrobiaceae bacterium]|nr:hypothetical protein [Acidimicrobiaceae bacterium]